MARVYLYSACGDPYQICCWRVRAVHVLATRTDLAYLRMRNGVVALHTQKINWGGACDLAKQLCSGQNARPGQRGVVATLYCRLSN